MSIYAMNALQMATYQTKTPANVVGKPMKLDSFTRDISNADFGSVTDSAVVTTDPLTQNVLQSLQSIGVNDVTLDSGLVATSMLSPNESEALKSFVQSLYKALTPENIVTTSSTVTNADGTSVVDDNLVSGGTNFKYTIDFSEANLGDNLAAIKENIKNALDNIGQYVASNAVFNLKVLSKSENSSMLAETNSTMTTATSFGQQSIDTSFVSDSIYGSELSPDTADAKLFINLARIDEMSFSGVPTPDKYDLTTIITHEVLHGLAFTGALNDGNVPLKTGYDELVTVQNGTPFFIGRHAKTANAGNAIPLSPDTSGAGSAVYHVAIPSDLMSESIKKGEVKTISPLDVAMLQDIGVTIASSKSLNPYDNSKAGLQNLIGSMQKTATLQVDFDKLVQSFGNNSNASLQDFLTKLASNIESGASLQNGVGNLLSVAA